jgi:hypothetical protein
MKATAVGSAIEEAFEVSAGHGEEHKNAFQRLD